MVDIWTGTVDVLNGDATVTVNTGDPLSDFNCFKPALVIIAGVPYFVESRTSSIEFEISIDYLGSDATDVDAQIQPLNSQTTSLVNLAQTIAQTQAQLSIFDKNSQGLFFNHIGVTGAADPGPGNLAFDNADPTLITKVYVDYLDANTANYSVQALVERIPGNARLRIRSLTTAAYIELNTTTGAVDSTGYDTLTVSYIDHDGVIADGEGISFGWSVDGNGLDVDAYGLFAGRDTYDDEASGFFYLSTNGDGDTLTGSTLFIKNSATSGDWSSAIPIQGDKGDQGDIGWSPTIVVETDDIRRVLKVTGYVGGTGTAPTTGVNKYLAASGFVDTAAEALNIRGSIWFYSTGVPDNGNGENNDNYINTLTGDLYSKISDTWVYQIRLKGFSTGYRLQFDDAIDDSDPGAGYFKFNHGTFESITKAWINDADYDGLNIVPYLNTFDDNINANARGYWELQDEYDPSKKLQFAIIGNNVDKTGYQELQLSPITGSIPTVETISVSKFIPSGSDGSDGSDGAGFPGLVVRSVVTTDLDITTDLEAGDTIGGYTGIAGQAILLTGQTDLSENGPYVVAASGAASRHPSFDEFDNICGAIFRILEGDDAGKTYVCNSPKGGTIDTTDLIFEELSGGNSILGLKRFASSEIKWANIMNVIQSSDTHFADDFTALTYVDEAGDTNVDTTEGGLLKPTVTGTAPDYGNTGGTGNRTGSITVTTNVTFNGGSMTNWINGAYDNTAYFTAGQSAAGKYFRFQFGSARCISEAKWYQGSSANTHGVWKWQGSNNGTDWTDIGSEFTMGGMPQTQTELSGNNTEYEYYQLLGVSGTISGSPWITEIEFKIGDAVVYNNTVMLSQDIPCSEVPANMMAMFLVEPIDSITLNTDLLLELSRDDNTTGTASNLSLYGSVGDLKLYISELTDVSSQPSDTAPLWELTSANNKNFKVHAAFLYFGE